MRTFTQTALVACFQAIVHASTYETITIDPPPSQCCESEWTSDAICNPIQTAIDAISTPSPAYKTLSLNPGTYCNKNWYKNKDTATSFKNSKLVGIDGYSELKIVAADENNKPVLYTDGWSGIQVKNSQ